MIQNMSKPRRASRDFSLFDPLYPGDISGWALTADSRIERSQVLLNVTTMCSR
jgi:hypothetical protein